MASKSLGIKVTEGELKRAVVTMEKIVQITPDTFSHEEMEKIKEVLDPLNRALKDMEDDGESETETPTQSSASPAVTAPKVEPATMGKIGVKA